MKILEIIINSLFVVGLWGLIIIGVLTFFTDFNTVNYFDMLDSEKASFYLWGGGALLMLVLAHILRGVILWLMSVAILALAVNVVASNTNDINFRLWPLDEPLAILPLWVIAVGCFAVGLFLGGLIIYPQLIASRIRENILSHELAQIEAQLEKNEAQKIVPQKIQKNESPWTPKDKNND